MCRTFLLESLRGATERTESNQSLVQHGPVPISFLDVLRNRLRPRLLHPLTVVQIKLAIDHCPRFGIDVHRVALADPVRAIPAVLGSVLLRCACELVAIFSTGEPPRRIHPMMGKGCRPFYRFTLREVRDWIVALDRDSASVFVDGIHF